jgi:Fe-S oxidoreductase
MSGEHGDGLARSHHNKRLFGPTLYHAFQRVKAAFDPQNILNPGKVVNAPNMTEDLRYGAEYRAVEMNTHFDFSREGGFTAAVEMCSGIGVCRKTLEGTMCPSYMVTREEEHSTRGRANALRAALSGYLPLEELTSKRMYDVLDLCLECKGCKGECPSNVDMAKIKYEFLAHYLNKHGMPLRSRMFANVRAFNLWGSRLAPFSNWVLRNKLARQLLRNTCAITSARPFPPFAKPNLSDWIMSHRGPDGNSNSQQVVLFNDCFMTYNYPQVGQAAVQLLERAGFRVLPLNMECCGRPMISKGLVEEARRCALKNVEAMSYYVRQGIPVVGCEPSCLLTLRDEYLDLLPGGAVTEVARHSFLIEEFLDNLRESGKLMLKGRDTGRRLLVHGHCHQKAHTGMGPLTRCLRLAAGLDVSEVDSGCCGMAGSFGFEEEHYKLSMEIGERRLFKTVREAQPEVEIVAPGVSCRQQIEHGTGRTARHPVEVLNEVLH